MQWRKKGIFYYICQEGDGKPLVCLHGFSEDHTTWEEIEIEGYSKILIDFVGHGKSDKPLAKKAYHVSSIMKQLKYILTKQLGLKKFSLMGYSMGARIALLFAITYPECVEKLILESGSYGIGGFYRRMQRRKKDMQLAENIMEQGIIWFEKYWNVLPIFESQKKLPNTVQRKIKKRRLLNEPYALAATLKGSGQGTFPYLKRRIKKLTMPVLYICGSLDRKYSRIGRVFQKENLNVTLCIISECGHNVHIEKPVIYQNKVIEFLRKENEYGTDKMESIRGKV